MTDERLQRANRLNAITQRIGFALWQLQELEGIAATYFILAAKAEQGMGEAAGNALLQQALGKPFGVTVTAMCKAGLFDAELEHRFRSLLQERNWLVHRSRATSRNAIDNDWNTVTLVDRIGAIETEAMALMNLLAGLAEAHVLRHGISQEQVDAQAARVLDEWHQGD